MLKIFLPFPDTVPLIHQHMLNNAISHVKEDRQENTTNHVQKVGNRLN